MLKQLEIEDEIHMMTPVKHYLEWFDSIYPLSIKQLMLHQSGLYKYKANPKFKDLNDATHAIQQRGINPLEYNKYQYNDANYLILSKVIETVTHKSYMQNLNERLVKPYNLEYTARYSNLNFQKYMAVGYKNDKLTGRRIRQKPNILNQYDGAGNLYMSPYDMGKWY